MASLRLIIRRSAVFRDQLKCLTSGVLYKNFTSSITRSIDVREKDSRVNNLCPAQSCDVSLIQKRQKYTRQVKQEEVLSEEEEDESLKNEQDSKIVTGHMSSLRADAVIKSGLGLARNKVEAMFYESRIRVNGAKISKKSQQVYVGDEVDMIKGVSEMNEEFLIISRVVVLTCRENDESDGLVVKLRRFKNLTVENYTQDPWKKTATA